MTYMLVLALLALALAGCAPTNISELVTALGKDPATSCTKMTLSTPWGTQTTTFARSNLVAGKVSCPGEGGLAVEAVK